MNATSIARPLVRGIFATAAGIIPKSESAE